MRIEQYYYAILMAKILANIKGGLLMLAQKYYQYKQNYDEEGVIFSFSGLLSEEILFALGDALKKRLVLEEMDTNTIKRVFSVFMEQVQNIIRYSAEHTSGVAENKILELRSGIVMVGSKDEQFYVGCGNTVSNSDAMDLRGRLEVIRKLGKDELRVYYREKLREGTDSSSKGANLGLIEIARRSSGPIEFDFLEIDADKSFFCIKSYI